MWGFRRSSQRALASCLEQEPSNTEPALQDPDSHGCVEERFVVELLVSLAILEVSLIDTKLQ